MIFFLGSREVSIDLVDMHVMPRHPQTNVALHTKRGPNAQQSAVRPFRLRTTH